MAAADTSEHTCRPPGKEETFRAADARPFLRDEAGGWSAIVVETHRNRRTLAQHLLIAEFYRRARSRLEDSGSLYIKHLI